MMFMLTRSAAETRRGKNTSAGSTGTKCITKVCFGILAMCTLAEAVRCSRCGVGEAGLGYLVYANREWADVCQGCAAHAALNGEKRDLVWQNGEPLPNDTDLKRLAYRQRKRRRLAGSSLCSRCQVGTSLFRGQYKVGSASVCQGCAAHAALNGERRIVHWHAGREVPSDEKLRLLRRMFPRQ